MELPPSDWCDARHNGQVADPSWGKDHLGAMVLDPVPLPVLPVLASFLEFQLEGCGTVYDQAFLPLPYLPGLVYSGVLGEPGVAPSILPSTNPTARSFHHHPSPIFTAQATVNDRLCIAPSSYTLLQDGSLPTRGTPMSLAPACFSGASHHSMSDQPSGAPATSGSISRSHGLETADHVPVQNMKSTSTLRKSTAKAHILGNRAQMRDQSLPTVRSRARLEAKTSVSYGNGCRLDHVKRGENAALIWDYDTLAFEGQKFIQKVSFRFHIEPFGPFDRQFNVLLGGKQPTKRRLAEVTVRAVERFMRDCAEHHHPFPYKLEHLILRSIEVVSRSSIRPVFDLVIPETA